MGSAGWGSYARCRQRPVPKNMIESQARATGIVMRGNWLLLLESASGEEDPLDPDFSSPGPKAVVRLTEKLSPDAPPSAPPLAPPEALAGEQREPAGLAPLLPLAEQALRNFGYRSGANFSDRGESRRRLGTARRAQRADASSQRRPFQAERCCLRFERSDNGANSERLRVGKPSSSPTAGLKMQGTLLIPATPA